MEQHDRGSQRGDIDIDIDGHVPRQHTCAKPVSDLWVRSNSAFNYLVCGGGLATLLILLGFATAGNARDGVLVVGYALAAVALVGFIRSFSIEVAFEPERLVVRNPLRTRHVAWSDIVEVGRVPTDFTVLPKHVLLRLRDGSTVSLRAVASVRARGYGEHHKQAERLRRAVETELRAHASHRLGALAG